MQSIRRSVAAVLDHLWRDLVLAGIVAFIGIPVIAQRGIVALVFVALIAGAMIAAREIRAAQWARACRAIPGAVAALVATVAGRGHD